MKIDKVITSCDSHKDYASFAAFTTYAWKVLGVDVQLNVVGNVFTPEQLKSIGQNCEIVEYPEVAGTYTGVIGKITRIISAAEDNNLDKNVMMADIDMVPLSAAPLKSYAKAGEDHLCKFGFEHPAFQQPPDIGKWPMHGTAGKGSTFREIVNPENLPFVDLVSYLARKNFTDKRATVTNHPSAFSDESLMHMLASEWDGRWSRCCSIRREEAGKFKQHPSGGYTVYGRVCRAKWPSVNGVNLDDYFEIHGPRPFTEEWYKPVIQYLKELGL